MINFKSPQVRRPLHAPVTTVKPAVRGQAVPAANAARPQINQKARDYLKNLQIIKAETLLDETPPYFPYPFAVGGDVSAIPETTQPDGSISYQQGYGPDYEQDLLTNPSALPIARTTMNQLFFDITTLLQQYSQYGAPFFITESQNLGTPFPYPQYARVYYEGQVYENQVADNIVLPGVDQSWVVISGIATNFSEGYISNFRNQTDADVNVINITEGTARDADNTLDFVLLPSTGPNPYYQKQFNVLWAPISSNLGGPTGGLAAGVAAVANSWYHTFVVGSPGEIDLGFDTSIEAVNLLADTGFTSYRRIGSLLTDGSGNPLAFYHITETNKFQFLTPIRNYSALTLSNSTSGTALAVSTPTSNDSSALWVKAELSFQAAAFSADVIYFFPVNAVATPVDPTVAPTAVLNLISSAVIHLDVLNSTLRVTTSTDDNVVLNLSTVGYTDARLLFPTIS